MMTYYERMEEQRTEMNMVVVVVVVVVWIEALLSQMRLPSVAAGQVSLLLAEEDAQF